MNNRALRMAAGGIGVMVLLTGEWALSKGSPPGNLADVHIRSVRPDRISVRPGETARISVELGNIENAPPKTRLTIFLKRWSGAVIESWPIQDLNETASCTVSTRCLEEGGYLIEALLTEPGRKLDTAREVLSVVQNVADDLRYGFYSNWDKPGDDYDRKTDFFAQLHINAIEYYDYFPAHGYYASKDTVYTYEPFGIRILGEDVRRKIEAARKRNILSIAYVAAYAASRSVYDRHPYPMTDASGVPRIFNGSVMTESEAKRQGKPIWFYLMAIAKDSKWRPHIMGEFKRALDDNPDDIVTFDGFEIDSYGHSKDDRYYSRGSRSNGRLLSDVITELVKDVRTLTHSLKDNAAVSFNCVNEFGIESMYDAVDFLFVENWAGHKNALEDLVDICYTHRRPKRQRVILKVYPADMRPGRKYWTPENLRFVLAAAMTGGGSVMVAGEPDERRGEMHALNSLYYPDNVAMPQENFDILRNYNFLDALLYRITHGANVINLETDVQMPGCVVRGFDSGEGTLAVQILHTGANREWSRAISIPAMRTGADIAISMPALKRPVDVYYASPDFEDLMIPQKLDWEFKEGRLRVVIPRISVYGVLVIKYET